ncbi:hypothetical protein GCM10009609_69930 [Pseudonocardia aurantiaca]
MCSVREAYVQASDGADMWSQQYSLGAESGSRYVAADSTVRPVVVCGNNGKDRHKARTAESKHCAGEICSGRVDQ